MNRVSRAFAIMALVLPVSVVQAAPTARARGEIDALIAGLGGSGCEFERNGSWQGSPPFSRTLTRRPIQAMRSVHVKAS